MKKPGLVFILFLCLTLNVSAQDSARVTKVSGERFFSFTYDNDFFAATDRYYTQGILISFIHPVLRKAPLSRVLPGLPGSINYHGLQVEQDVFTARSIRYKGGAVYEGERPFTAVFFVSQLRNSLSAEKQLALYSQLDLGIIGPEALGEEEQKAIHKSLNNIEPQGWSNQLNTDFVLNYRIRADKALLQRRHLEVLGQVSARLGTLYTDAGVGVYGRCGIFKNYFQGLQAERAEYSSPFRIFLFARTGVRMVGYNATLQGGLFSDTNIYELPDNSITRTVVDVSGGVVMAYRKLTLEYSRFYVSKEFEEGLEHSWGRCSVMLCF